MSNVMFATTRLPVDRNSTDNEPKRDGMSWQLMRSAGENHSCGMALPIHSVLLTGSSNSSIHLRKMGWERPEGVANVTLGCALSTLVDSGATHCPRE